MNNQFLSISIILIIVIVLINGTINSPIFAITKASQNYQVGYADGCQDKQSNVGIGQL